MTVLGPILVGGWPLSMVGGGSRLALTGAFVVEKEVGYTGRGLQSQHSV